MVYERFECLKLKGTAAGGKKNIFFFCECLKQLTTNRSLKKSSAMLRVLPTKQYFGIGMTVEACGMAGVGVVSF